MRTNRDALFILIECNIDSKWKTKSTCVIHAVYVPYASMHSYLSWGALLYRFDDGDSVPLFQGKAVASIAGPYLEKIKKKKDTSPITQIPSHQNRTTEADTGAGAQQPC